MSTRLLLSEHSATAKLLAEPVRCSACNKHRKTDKRYKWCEECTAKWRKERAKKQGSPRVPSSGVLHGGAGGRRKWANT